MNSQLSSFSIPRSAGETPPVEQVDLRREFAEVGIGEVLDQLDGELIGLKPVKTRIREIASLLGSTRESVTVRLNAMRRAGTIDFVRRKILVKRRESLVISN